MYNPATGRFLNRDPIGVQVRGHFASGRFGAGSGMTEVGRFITRDRAGPSIEFADGMNLYQYVRSSPVRFTDHTGLAVGIGAEDPPIILPPNPNVPINIVIQGNETVCGQVAITGLAGCNAEIHFENLAKIGNGCAAPQIAYALAVGDRGLCKYIQEEWIDKLPAGKAYIFECKEGKKCCYRRQFDGDYPVNIRFNILIRQPVTGSPDCRITGRLTATATASGTLGICR